MQEISRNEKCGHTPGIYTTGWHNFLGVASLTHFEGKMGKIEILLLILGEPEVPICWRLLRQLIKQRLSTITSSFMSLSTQSPTYGNLWFS